MTDKKTVEELAEELVEKYTRHFYGCLCENCLDFVNGCKAGYAAASNQETSHQGFYRKGYQDGMKNMKRLALEAVKDNFIEGSIAIDRAIEKLGE